MALIQFAITLFVSAFILFLVQPIIGKLVLPKLGGTPQVWNTCMVFFQTMLLLGYFYTHFVTNRLRPRMQLILHCILLAAPLLISDARLLEHQSVCSTTLPRGRRRSAATRFCRR
ncbi:MAG: hypothetical protein U0744_09015 [Gemmataceae bacterium]